MSRAKLVYSEDSIWVVSQQCREAGELLILLNNTDWGIAEDAESSPGLVLQPTANIVSVFGAREPLCCDILGWNAENARTSRGGMDEY